MAAHQAPPSLGFSRQEHWSELPFPSPMHESEKSKWSRSVVSNPVRPHRRQPTRLPHPWDSLGKNTGVGCHLLLQCMKVKSQSEVTQLCPTLSDPMDCSIPGSSVHGIFQARVLGGVPLSLPLAPTKSNVSLARIQCKAYHYNNRILGCNSNTTQLWKQCPHQKNNCLLLIVAKFYMAIKWTSN